MKKCFFKKTFKGSKNYWTLFLMNKKLFIIYRNKDNNNFLLEKKRGCFSSANAFLLVKIRRRVVLLNPSRDTQFFFCAKGIRA